MNNQLEKDETKLKSKLSGYYDTEARKLEKEIGAFYQQYGKDDIIEYRTLMQTMSEEDKKLLIERMDDFQDKYPEYGYILPVRENIYKLNRLEGLQQSILMQQYEMGAIDEATLKKHLEKQALLGANAMAKELGFGENFYSMNPDIIKKLINQKWANGSNFSDSIWKNRQKLADYLNSDFAAGIARGDNYQKLIRDLQKRFGDVSRRDMYRLIYTEGTFALNEGMVTPFEEDFEEYRFSIADSNACGKCQAINGKKYSIKDRKPGVNFPPLHSWCRCSFTIEIPDDFIEQYEAKHGGKQPSKVLQDSPKAGTMKEKEIPLGELEEAYGKKHSKEIRKQLGNAPEQCKRVWNDCVNDFHCLDPKYRGDKAYYSPGFDAVKLSISRAAKGSSYKTPYNTVFHEYGHHADYILNRKYGNGDRKKAFSETYKNGIFGQTLKKEAKKAIEEFAESKSAIIADDIAKEFCKQMKQELSLIQRTDISDMFEPIMPKSCEYPFGVGHGSSYWNSRDNGKEAFAEMYSAMVNNPESLEQIKRFFPESYKIFMEMLGVVK